MQNELPEGEDPSQNEEVLRTGLIRAKEIKVKGLGRYVEPEAKSWKGTLGERRKLRRRNVLWRLNAKVKKVSNGGRVLRNQIA